MEINSLESPEAIYRLHGTCMGPGMGNGMPRSIQLMHGDSVSISKNGSFINMLSSLSEEGRAEMKDYHGQMRDAIVSGTFDAAVYAENAPDELKALAEENGIDLEEMFARLEQRISSMNMRMAGFPYSENETGIENSGHPIMSLIDQVFTDSYDEESENEV